MAMLSGEEALDLMQQALALEARTADGLGESQSNADAQRHPKGCSCCPIIVSLNVGMAAIERGDQQQHMTALGLSVLDTSHLRNVPPGVKGGKWASEIEAILVTIAERQTTHTRLAVEDTEGSHKDMKLSEAETWMLSMIDRRFRTVIVIGHNVAFHTAEIKKNLGCDVAALDAVLGVLDLRDIYSHAGQAVAGYDGPHDLYGILASLDVGDGNRSNPGNRALYISQAILAIVCDVKAANDPDFVFDPPALPPNGSASHDLSNQVAALPEIEYPELETSVTQASTSVADSQLEEVQTAAPSFTVTATSAQAVPAHSAPVSASEKLLRALPRPLKPIILAAPASRARPTVQTNAPTGTTAAGSTAPNTKASPVVAASVPVTVAPYNNAEFTTDDWKTVRVFEDEITNLPPRIYERVAKYSEKTAILETKLLSYAKQYEYPNLTAATEHYTNERTHVRSTKIATPIANFELLTQHICRTHVFSTQNINFVKGIIQLRTFVSDWYSDIPGISDGSEVAEKTKAHRAFVAMLERLVQRMEGSRRKQQTASARPT